MLFRSRAAALFASLREIDQCGDVRGLVAGIELPLDAIPRQD